MRIVYGFAGGLGHLEPLVPLALAARDAGHDVAFVARPWMVPKAQALGFETFSAGLDAGLVPERRPLLPVDLEREARDLRDGFVSRIGRERARDLVPVLEQWQPDVLVWEETDFGAPVAAERLGIPHASVIVLAAATYVRPALFRDALDELRADHGLPSDPELEMLRRHLVLAPLPPSYRDPADPLPPNTHYLRPNVRPLMPGEPVPPWLDDLGARPVVYFSLGTVFHVESGDLFSRVIEGVRDLAVDLVVTVGNEIDPAELGPQPPNVRIERFIPQAAVLPRADLVISHGGSGSVLGALVHGLPMVIVAMGADQPLNGARCETLGLARVLDPIAATPASVREAVAVVLGEPGYRAVARRLRAEIEALPGPEQAVELIGRLTDALPVQR